MTAPVAGFLARLGEGLLKGRDRRDAIAREEQLRRERLAQQDFSNSIATGQLQRLQESLDFQQQQAQAAARQKADERARRVQSLMGRGMNQADADAMADDDVAYRDQVKPLPPKMTPWQQAGFASEQDYLDYERKHTDATTRPPAEQKDHFTFPVGTDADGKPVVLRANTSTGEVAPTDVGAKQAQLSGLGASAIKQKVAKNRANLAVIDDALAELGNHPSAVGLTRGLPVIGSALDQRADPQGVAARASIANIGSLVIHDRSGAAVTIHEFPRLAPFVPSVNDTPEAIRTKLAKLKEFLTIETNLLDQSGMAPPTTRTAAQSADTGTLAPQKAGLAPLSDAVKQKARSTPAFADMLRQHGYSDQDWQ